jgi:hypothetical protein
MQQSLFDHERIQSCNKDGRKPTAINVKSFFKAPESIRLGDLYVSYTGRVMLAMKYVVDGKNDLGMPVVKLQVREGRENPFEYKLVSVDSFARAVESKKLVMVV